MQDIFIIIPNWNGADLIASCIESLQKQSIKLEVVVVDNGSTDASLEIMKSQFPGIHLIELDTNTGFTGGVNRGIQYALDNNARYVLLFNNDAIADEKWAKELVSSANIRQEVGIVTGKFLRLDKKHLDSTGDFYSIWGLPFPRGRNEVDTGQYDNSTEIFGATGGASLYKADMLRKIGIFDDNFFAYYEDVDISFRAQLAGWKVIYNPKAIAYHHVSATSSQLGDFARYHSAKNFLLVYTKNMPAKLYFKYLPLFTLQFLRMGATSLVKGKFTVFIRGAFAALRIMPTVLKNRKHIQSNSKVTRKYIDSILYHKRPPKPANISS